MYEFLNKVNVKLKKMNVKLKKMKLKLFILLLCLAPFASVVGQEFEVNGINYRLEQEKTTKGMVAYVADNKGNAEPYVIIPDSVYYGGKSFAVTGIGEEAFYNCENLISINLPKSLKEIGRVAFARCYNLTSISIPDSVTYIYHATFYYCIRLASVNLPKALETIDDEAFQGCQSLTSINIPGSTTRIGRYAFQYCTNLTSVNLPESLRSIGFLAFDECKKLTTINFPIDYGDFFRCPYITFPESWGEEEEGINLTAVNFPMSFIEVDGVCYRLGETKLGVRIAHVTGNARGDSQVTIPNKVIHNGKSFTVVGVERHAFSGDSLTSINLPKSLKTIGESAFAGCSSLTSIDLPKSLEEIDRRAFSYTGLISINLPESLKKIGSGVFNCESDTVTYYIDDVAIDTVVGGGGLQILNIDKATLTANYITFGSNLQTISVSKNNSRYMVKDGVLFSKNQDTLFCYPAQKTDTLYNIPNGVKEIMPTAFSYCVHLKSVTIPVSMAQIGKSAFWLCYSLEKVTIPSSIKSIGEYAFGRCKSLKHIDLPNSIERIEESAFYDCYSVTSLHIPNSITKIDDEVFRGTGIVSIEIPSSVVEIGNSAFSDCSQLKEITLPNTLKKIGGSAFSKCKSLENIVLPDSLQFLGGSAFSDCLQLKEITLPNTLKKIGGGVFSGCELIENVVLPDSLQYIAYGLFSGSNIKNITIPKSVKGICSDYPYNEGACEFLSKNMKEVVVLWDNPSDISVYGNNSYNGDYIWGARGVSLRVPKGTKELYEADGHWNGFREIVEGDSRIPFSFTSEKSFGDNDVSYWLVQERADEDTVAYIYSNRYRNVSNIIIPDSILHNGKYFTVTLLGWYAFQNSEELISVHLPKSLKEIGERAFKDCRRLTSINLPQSLKKINRYAFDGCKSLTSISIPNSVTHIAVEAFAGSGIRELKIDKAIPDISTMALSSSKLQSISVSKDNKRYMVKDGVLFSKNQDTLFCYPAQKADTLYNIPNGVKIIMPKAFFACAHLKSITIPASMTTIGDYAFFECLSLERVTIPSNIQSIEAYAFSNCKNLKHIDLPNTIEKIGVGAFESCKNLTALHLPNSITKIEHKTFFYSGIVSIEIPNSVVEIGREAFFYCPQLKEITLPNTLREIGRNAFLYCKLLETIVLPDSLQSIACGLFSDSGLKKIIIPAGVKKMCPTYYSFEESTDCYSFSCENLEEITVLWNNPSDISIGGSGNLHLDSEEVILRVPKGTKKLYKADERWSAFKKIVEH